MAASAFSFLALVSLLLRLAACSSPSTEANLDASVLDAAPDAYACSLDCNGECIDPQTSHDNCGATDCRSDDTDGVVCTGDQMCEDGACVEFACQTQANFFHLSCNPVNNAGCDFGSKCAQLVESVDPFLSLTICVPDGYADVGEACRMCDESGLGYDNCKAGSACGGGICREFCSRTPDSCRTPELAAEQGSHCARFTTIEEPNGLCMAACAPLDEIIEDGQVKHPSCALGEGCYLSASDEFAICSRTTAEEATQNDDCTGPNGICSLTGCAPGFAPLLPNQPLDPNSSLCARYCEPANTHAGAIAGSEGKASQCGDEALAALGGTNGNTSPHQCRFVQSFYSDTSEISETIGMCVPTLVDDKTWGDCTAFDWDGAKAVWNEALANGDDAQDALDEFCGASPDDLENVLPRCLGLYHGCISQAEQLAGLPGFGL